MASIENGIPPFQCRTIWCWVSPGADFHQEDERGGRIAYCPPLNPRAPPKDMEKMMGILRNLAAPRRRRDHVDRNRKHFRQRPSWSKSWTFCDWSIFSCNTTNQDAEKSTKRSNQILLSIEACITGPRISQHVEVASPMSIGQIATSQWEKYLTMFPPMTFKCNVVSRVWLESFSNWIVGTKS
jgi:hypothetical protein